MSLEAIALLLAAWGCGGNEPRGGADAAADHAGRAAGEAGVPADGGAQDAATDAGPPPPPLPTWSRRIGTFTDEGYQANPAGLALQTPDRHALVPAGAAGAAWIVDLTAEGEIEWQTRIDALVPLAARAVPAGIVVLGVDPDRMGFQRVDLAEDGASFARTTFSLGAVWSILSAATVAEDGSSFAAGMVQLAGEPVTMPWSVQVGADGSLAASTRWVTPFGVAVSTAAVAALDDGSARAIAGSWSELDQDAWVATMDAEGALVSSLRFGGAEFEDARAIAATPEGGWIVAGATFDLATDDSDAWVFTLDAAGAVAWQRTYGTAGPDGAWAVVSRAGAGFAFAGLTEQDGLTRLWLVAIAPDGEIEWQRAYGAVGSGRPGGVAHLARTDDGGFLLTAQRLAGPWETDLWVLQLDPEGGIAGGDCAAVLETDATSEATTVVAVEAPIFADDALLFEESADDGAGSTPDHYVRAECGDGESTDWGTTGVSGDCECGVASTCVGPETGCDVGLTCVGHYSEVGDPIGDCAHGCTTHDDCPGGSTCHVLRVGDTFLGSWCY